MLQLALICGFGLLFLLIEFRRPGRVFPKVAGWYERAIFLNICQLGVVVLAGFTWNQWLQSYSLFVIQSLPAFLQGLLGWFVGTFVFYWWHVARHRSNFLWRTLHQIHHSPSRIEVLTAFYKHPLEIIADSILANVVMFVVLGASVEGAAWFNVFAAVGEYFYHCNMKTPAWLGYFIQRPENHSIHHQIDVHRYNFGDLPIWDRFFGTYKDTDDFVVRCGFPEDREKNIGKMLVFKDNYN